MRSSLRSHFWFVFAVGLAITGGSAGCTDAGLPTDAPALEAAGRDAGGSRLYRVEPSMFPFYTRTELTDLGEYGYRTDSWAAVVFYRQPSCVPADFNLFDFYDFTMIPMGPPRPFLCDATVSGFSLHVEPAGVTPPKQSNLSGSAVPIWFVPAAVFQTAVAAGVLTVPQLEAMPGLVKATASQFREINQTIEMHPQPGISITARGLTDDGRRFDYDITWNGTTLADIRNVQIRIR
ncbi:hypothetical protein BH23GEM9_BH23GEM9_26030 [soil metagenome]